MMLMCTEIQERIVAGESLTEGEQSHVLDCLACARLVADCVALDGLLAAGVDDAVAVPDDFADRVMRALGEQPASGPDLLGRPWVQLVLANLGIAVALVNLVRFVFAPLIPTATLGGMP